MFQAVATVDTRVAVAAAVSSSLCIIFSLGGDGAGASVMPDLDFCYILNITGPACVVCAPEITLLFLPIIFFAQPYITLFLQIFVADQYFFFP